MNSRKIIFLFFVPLIITIDQLFKYYFLKFWPHLVVKNKGVAFGLFPGGWWIFISLLLIVIVFYLLIDDGSCQTLSPTSTHGGAPGCGGPPVPATRRFNYRTFGLTMIAAGGIANLIDRITKGVIIDFIKIPLWPTAFNMADLAITVGVLLFLWNQKLFTKTNK